MNNKKYSIFMIIGLILVMSLFVWINLFYNKDNKVNNNQIFDKSNVENLNYKLDKIMIEGVEETIKVVKYNSHLGFSLSYDVEKFKPSVLSNGVVEFTYYENEEVKLRVEKLNENDYYEMYQSNRDDEIIDNNKYSYKYMRKNNSYYRLVTIMPNSLEYSDMEYRIGYMNSNFDIN